MLEVKRKKRWLTLLVTVITAVGLVAAGFLSSHYLLTQKTNVALDRCEQELEVERRMLRTWCEPSRIRIGQCEDEVYVCLCSSPDEFDL